MTAVFSGKEAPQGQGIDETEARDRDSVVARSG